MNHLAYYVKSMPQPGSGNCNRFLLGAANIGVYRGLSDADITATIMANLTNPGAGTEQAVSRAIARAKRDVRIIGKNQQDKKLVAPTPGNIRTILPMAAKWLTRNLYSVEDAMGRSPIQLSGNAVNDALLALQTLFSPNDLLFIGNKFGKTIKTCREWAKTPASWDEFIIPNPLDGDEHQTKNGKNSHRCDAAVPVWQYAVAEFDNLSIGRQIFLWLNVDLPVAALVFSGGKSVHAWIYANTPREKFNLVNRLYDDAIIPLGADPACRNPSRLSRMPGVKRQDRQAVQQVIWLNDPTQIEVDYGFTKGNRESW